jgi:hydrogenase maturation factor
MTGSRRFPTGKIPSDVLRKIVFEKLGVPNERLLQGPQVGEDAAVIDLDDKVLVVATDPITGAIGNVGWLAVHINANDVASTGAKPLWFLCVTLLPEGSDESLLVEIMDQIHTACTEVGVTLIGGHTETTPGLDRPILIGFMMGEAGKKDYVTTGGAKPGDQIILTKGAGIEGTAIIAGDLRKILVGKVEEKILRSAEEKIKEISVVPEAMKAVHVGGVHSLHDPTEGGLLNGIWEMAEAAGVGVEIMEDMIPVASETRILAEVLELDPLKLMGSGALLIVVEPQKTVEMVDAIKAMGVEASTIGEIKPITHGRVLVRKDGNSENIVAVDQDEVYRILEKHGF